MFYVKEITTDANTAQGSPKESTVKVWAGVIHHVGIMFPQGPAGLLHVQIWHGGHQIYPSTELQDFAGNDETIRFNDNYQLHVGLNTLTIKTWNEDDTYPHKCRVRIGVLPMEVVAPHMMFIGIRSSLRRLLARVGVT